MGSSCLLTEGSTRMRKLVLIFLICLGTLMLTKCESQNSLRENVMDDPIVKKLLHAESSSIKSRREAKNKRTGRKKKNKKKQKNRNKKKSKRKSSKNKSIKTGKRGKKSGVDKKKSSKKKNKENKRQINCARQENDVFCPQQKAISLKLLYNQVTNFNKQRKELRT